MRVVDEQKEDEKCNRQDEKENVEKREAAQEEQKAALKEWEAELLKKVREAEPVRGWMNCVVEEVVSQIQDC